MPFNTAIEKRLPYLYHWQPFTAANAHCLEKTLATNTIYCPSPAKFNDPWDCKPHFSTQVLEDLAENEAHAQWAGKIYRSQTPPIPEDEIARRLEKLRSDRGFSAGLIDQMTAGVGAAISVRYSVYCLGTDPTSLLMWSHYADSHRGICLQFVVRDDVICGALKCEYEADFPVMKVYSHSDADNIRILRVKAKAWEYEDEYRLIAQERAHAIAGDTLVTDDSLLRLTDRSLCAVIVGCQGDYDAVVNLVRREAPRIAVRKAVRVPNRFELKIEG